MKLPSPLKRAPTTAPQAARQAPLRLLIVDDSLVVRRSLARLFRDDPAFEVVGEARDPYEAETIILKKDPQVLTLDLEMPRMDGLTFLRQLMRHKPMPAVILSSLSTQGSQYALQALSEGAFHVLAKPHGSYSFGDLGPQLRQALLAAGEALAHGWKPTKPASPTTPTPSPSSSASPLAKSTSKATDSPASSAIAIPKHPVPMRYDPRQILLLGASTGGTEALKNVLVELPAKIPPIAIVQHIPAGFSRAFADRLNTLCPFEVREAKDGDNLTPGLALVAPGDWHMLLTFAGGHYRVQLRQGPPVWHQRPAVDLLFKSAAPHAKNHAVAAVLTGMGRDGAEGLLKLRELGAATYAQDEASSVVWGMPRAAWENGAAQQQVPLNKMSAVLMHALNKPNLSHAATLRE